MANRTRFAGLFRAVDYAFGIASETDPLSILTGVTSTGAGTVTLANGVIELSDGTKVAPLSTNAPVYVGSGSNRETVTPTAVSNPSGQSLAIPTTMTATFVNTHGTGDLISSASIGLQEAINDCATRNGAYGGIVMIDGAWYLLGGTLALIQAAILPPAGNVRIWDTTTGQFYANAAASTSVIAAPSAATSATVASQTATGTWTAITEHVLFTYITANGGETLASADYSFTATASVAIGGTGPAAATGVVGYRVYIGANATTTCYMVPVIAANGTVIQAGPIACFKIGTPFSVALVTTSAFPLPPLVQSTAFGTVQPQPFGSLAMAQPFQAVSGPFAVTGVVTAGTAIEWGKVQLPTAFLNQVNRKLRITLEGYYTPVSTATLIITVAIQSVYGTTTTTVFTVTTPASSGTTAANINGVIDIATAATGATGTVECHGYLLYGGATGTAGLLVAAGDSVITVSSAIDLTKQDAIVVSINSGTANLTQSQLRKMIVEVLQ